MPGVNKAKIMGYGMKVVNKTRDYKKGLRNHVKKVSMICFFMYLLGFSSLQGQYYQPIACSQETPCCDTLGQFFVRGDYLYWTTSISGLELDFGNGSVIQSSSDEIQIIATQELDLDPHFKWESGYRIAAGWQFGCSDWEIDALWTHFQNKGTRTVDGEQDVINSGTCKVKLDQVDVVLAYQSTWCSFTLKPFLGVRLAKIDEHVNAQVSTNITILPDTFGFETRIFDDNQHSKVIGPLLGFQGDWEIGCGFGIYGNAAASLLYGYHKAHFEDSDTFTVPLIRETASINRKHLHRFNWNVDLALGIRWHTCLCDSLEFGLKVGFEHHEYFNQSLIGVERGDISFDGAVVSAVIGF